MYETQVCTHMLKMCVKCVHVYVLHTHFKHTFYIYPIYIVYVCVFLCVYICMDHTYIKNLLCFSKFSLAGVLYFTWKPTTPAWNGT